MKTFKTRTIRELQDCVDCGGPATRLHKGLQFCQSCYNQEINRLIDLGICPDCGYPLTYSEGCELCRGCGWSLCNN